MSIPYEEVPLIVNVTHLHDHVLLVEFDNGEKRTCDQGDYILTTPAAARYAPLDEFKKFCFNSHTVWWGIPETIDTLHVGHDSFYLASVPYNPKSKPELGIFWLDDSYSKVIHSKTVLEEDIDKNEPDKYAFQHCNEWANRPEGIPGDYKDYPRGRIFYQGNKYVAEVNFQTTSMIEAYICQYFSLPADTVFKTGFW